MTIAATDQNFEHEVLQATTLVLVDFAATWCGPCKALAPLIDALATEHLGVLKVAKLDVDDSPETPEKFGIHSVPTIVLFKGGQEIARKVGLLSKAKLAAMVKPHLAAST